MNVLVRDATDPVAAAVRMLPWEDYLACCWAVCDSVWRAYSGDEVEPFADLVTDSLSTLRLWLADGISDFGSLEERWERVSEDIREGRLPGLINLRTVAYVLCTEMTGTSRNYASIGSLFLPIVNWRLGREHHDKGFFSVNARVMDLDSPEYRCLQAIRELAEDLLRRGRGAVLENPPLLVLG
ncbi:hypothetical protein ABH920_001932 [Catenulispora sp. EB89]|uniref:hypothetical protein n=1 Tax=Catenulispora sp. EB89 TaxID=3156257 RepID=UPI003512E19A